MMKELQKPILVGTLMLRNRLVMPPMATALATPEGRVTQEILDYYGQRAKSGDIGLIITEHAYITKQGRARTTQMSISSDDDVPGLKQLTDVIHAGGTRTFAQLNHAGSAAFSAETGMPAVSASAVVLPVTPGLGDSTPEAMTVEQIHAVTQDFVAAALRAKEAGYDGVEIHSAHAYLLNQFYSPLTNQRQDEYGGSLENRLRFLLETVAAVRSAVGEEYPIAVRLGGCDYRQGGSTIDDAVAAAVLLEQAGVDLLDLSGGMCRYTREGHTEPGYFADMSAEAAARVRMPVLLTGGVTAAEQADALLQSGAADLIGVGRALLKDAHWAEKAFA